MTINHSVGSGIALGRLSKFDEKPFSITVGTEHGPVRATISDNGDVQVTQGGKVTHLPYSGGI